MQGLDILWWRCSAARVRLGPVEWGTFAKAAGELRHASLLVRLWKTYKVSIEPTAKTIGAFANAAGNVRVGWLLRQIWKHARTYGIALGSAGWGTFAKAAGSAGQGDLLKEIWQARKEYGWPEGSQEWVSFVASAGKARQPLLVAEMWQVRRQMPASMDSREWSAFATAAGETGQPDFLREIWEVRRADISSIESGEWGSFANAAGELGIAPLLTELWEAYQGSGAKLTAEIAGSFAKAAGELGQDRLLWEVWRRCYEWGIFGQVWLESIEWVTFAIAASKTDCPELLREIWKARQPQGPPLTLEEAGAFAKAAVATGQTDLLMPILDAWNPQPGTLERRPPEHPVWGLLLYGAFQARDEDLLLRIFQRLGACFDPTQLPHRGTLEYTLWAIVNDLGDTPAARYIRETITCLRLDTGHCFRVLATVSSASINLRKRRRFVGAARCLARWLVNTYFWRTPEEFSNSVAELVEGVFSLKSFERLPAWEAILCTGQEAYLGCLRAKYFQEFRAVVSPFLDLTDEDLCHKIKSKGPDGILEAMRSFETRVSEMAIGQDGASWEESACPESLEALVELLATSTSEYLTTGKKIDREKLINRASEILRSAGASSLPKADWRALLPRFVQRMSMRCWDTMIKSTQLKGETHNLRRKFQRAFHEPLCSQQLSEEQELDKVRAARRFLEGMGVTLRRYVRGKPSAINIARRVKDYLVWGMPNREANAAAIPRRFTVAGWTGMARDFLVPMLEEIRFNARRAMREMQPELQTYEVSLRAGEGDEAGYAVLTVRNACPEHAEDDPFSTGFGRGRVQWLAVAMGGWATYDTKHTDEHGQRLHTWSICLPLEE